MERRYRYHGSDLTKTLLVVLALSMALSLIAVPVIAPGISVDTYSDAACTIPDGSFELGETVYFKAVNLNSGKYYKFMLVRPDASTFYVGSWTTGVTSLIESYALLVTDQTGNNWKVRIMEASDDSGTGGVKKAECTFTATRTPRVATYSDAAYTIPDDQFAPLETVYFKATGLDPSMYHRFKIQPPSGPDVWIGGGWVTGVAELTGSYVLPFDAPSGSWRVHTRESAWSDGHSDYHVVDADFSISPSLYIATISPTSALCGETKTYTLNFTNYPSSTTKLGSVSAAIPSGWTGVTITSVTPPPGKTWTASIASGLIKAAANDHMELVAGEFVLVTFSAVAPLAPAVYEWTTLGYGGRGWSGTSFSLVGPQPTVTVTCPPGHTVSFTQTGSGVNPTVEYWIDSGSHVINTVPFGVVVDDGHQISYVYQQIVPGAAGIHYVLTGVSPISPQTVTADVTVTGTYKTQYNVSFSQSGSGAAVTVGYSLSNGTSGSKVAPFWFWVDKNLQITYTYPTTIAGGAGVQYALTGVAPSSPQTVTSPLSILGSYKTQFYITVVSAHDSPTASAWVDKGSNYATSVTSPTEIVASDHQWVCTGYRIDGGSLAAGTSYNFINVQAPHTISFEWKEQFYLTVTSAHDSPTGDGWYDDGATASSSVTSPVSGGTGVQYVATGYTGTGSAPSGSGTSVSFTITQASSITWNWKTQFYITVTSAHDTPTASAWVDQGSNYATSVTSPTEIVAGDHQFVCTGYQIDGGSLAAGTSYNFINVQAPHTILYNWKEQFWIQVNSVRDTPTASAWVDQGDGFATSVTSPADDDGFGTRYRCTGYTLDANPPVTDGTTSYNFVNVQSAHVITWNWIVQYRLTVASDHDSPNPGVGDHWYDTGAEIAASVTSPADQSGGIRYRCTGYTGTGSAGSGSDDHVTFNIGASSTLTWNWIAQYKITVDQTGVGSDFTGTIVIVAASNYGYADLPEDFWWDSGSVHNFAFQSPLVVVPDQKRYVWDSTAGLSVLQSDSITVSVSGGITGDYITQYKLRFAESGLDASATGTVVTVNAATETYTVLPFLTDWLDEGSSVTYSYEAIVGSTNLGEQFRLDHVTGPASPITVTTYQIVTGYYVTQFYLTMTTNFGSILPGSGWHDAGSAVAISAAAPIAVAGERYVWLGWTGTGIGNYTGTLNPKGITMNGPITEAAAWRREFRLTVVSLYDSPNPTVGDHWYATGTTINALVTSPALGPPRTRYVCTGWTGSGSVPATGNTTAVIFVIAAPSRITWNWKIQFYLNVSSAHGTVGGEGWYDPGTTAYALVEPLIVEEAGGVRYVFINWTGDATGNTSPSDPILMNKDKVAIANWNLELRLDVVSAYDSPYGAGWYEPGATANFGVTTPVDLGNGTLLVFVGWSGDVTQTAPTGSIVMTEPSRVVAAWIRQYLVTFNTTLPDGVRLTIPGVPQALPPGLDIFGAFFEAGSTAAGGPAPLTTPGPDGIRYVFKGWDLDGVLLTPGTDFLFLVNGPHNASMVFDTEFLLVVNATGVATPFNATLTITASPPVPYQLNPISALEEWFRKNAGLSLLISTPNKIGHGVWAVFKQWSGSVQGTDESVSLVMSGPKTVNAVFFSTNPVAESLPYSIVAGLICFGLAYYMTRNKKGEQKGSTRMTFGTAVVAIALLVAAIMSAMIATGFGINVAELPDLTNWAVLFLGAEALVLFYITHRFTKGGQPEQAQAAPETAKVPANPYGV